VGLIDGNSTANGGAVSVADRLIAELSAGVEHGVVPAGVFGNEDLYRAELRRIYGRCWVYLAHESEIPAKGDYVARKIGEDPFIVIRGSDDRVRVFLNACRHRGVQICRADFGNANGFTCPYHGWAYDSRGNLLGGPLWNNAFGDMSKADNGLISPPKVDTIHGLIFASLDPTVPPLLEYLGGMKWYIDLIFGLNEHGVEILGPPQRFIIPANWKSGAENFAGDDYHLGMLHRSVWDIGVYPVPFEANMMGHHIQASAGHSLSFSMAPEGDESGPHFYAYPEDIAATFNTSRISADQLEIARRSRVIVGTIFPNFSILALPTTYDGARLPPIGVLTLRVWQPHGHSQVEVWNWFAAYRNMSPEQKERVYRSGLYTFSMGGVFEMDDTDPWSTATSTGHSVAAELLDFRLNYQMGLPGIGIAQRTNNWPGPGICYSPRYEEGVQRNLLRFYANMMRSQPGEWPNFEPG
jgi:phenylpropionate dioxygenase-like ring-hydroxylating dioxygenase large terminal subunit